MFGSARIGLTAVLVAALIALGASPAYAATKKTGTIASGSSVTLLNTSGYLKVTFNCNDTVASLGFVGPGNPVHVWVENTSGPIHFTQVVPSNGSNFGSTSPKPGHYEWSASQGTKVTFGEVYEAEASGNSNDCVYTSLIS